MAYHLPHVLPSEWVWTGPSTSTTTKATRPESPGSMVPVQFEILHYILHIVPYRRLDPVHSARGMSPVAPPGKRGWGFLGELARASTAPSFRFKSVTLPDSQLTVQSSASRARRSSLELSLCRVRPVRYRFGISARAPPSAAESPRAVLRPLRLRRLAGAAAAPTWVGKAKARLTDTIV